MRITERSVAFNTIVIQQWLSIVPLLYLSTSGAFRLMNVGVVTITLNNLEARFSSLIRKPTRVNRTRVTFDAMIMTGSDNGILITPTSCVPSPLDKNGPNSAPDKVVTQRHRVTIEK
jgi:hypothetical protein